jgi:hypothetical protein
MSDVKATVREVDGQLVLDDPDALAVMKAVAKHNCRQTLLAQADRVAHFKQRAIAKGVDNVLIVLLNVDDPIGAKFTEALMPGQEAMWHSLRESGQVPFARGLAVRDSFEKIVSDLDPETGAKLKAMAGKVAVLVSDHGVLEAFEA